ncbi:hypothetical protein GCK72_012194 [Caenorhabditis remanei]|uniref:Uncharacterized protein n=1 Tax=Caenorhabditis remanei TaxID=31234 RepID=A0A6A5GM90_CAERE|nr:hypothetical protein GCK72_012193 [Caenorhabditis remanei]XP_053583681.1 hypothetical protein GCK72_012194 [Caenorhabditis remanei]KAF1755743.1 hypothetical protein GCK72_012193 [Caenorhabditis remanei]KAF1755744.1 hypothetical protein GCK72_012194 [Caenorhabditis remanei]
MVFYSNNTFCSAPVKISPCYGMWNSQLPGLEIITAIDVAGLKILLKAGAVDHIFEKHGQDFEYAARGAFNLEAREYQVANYIKESILNAPEIFITDCGVNRADSLALYYKRTCDKMHHRFFLAHEGGNVYRINTGYKLFPEEQLFLLN